MENERAKRREIWDPQAVYGSVRGHFGVSPCTCDFPKKKKRFPTHCFYKSQLKFMKIVLGYVPNFCTNKLRLDFLNFEN